MFACMKCFENVFENVLIRPQLFVQEKKYVFTLDIATLVKWCNSKGILTGICNNYYETNGLHLMHNQWGLPVWSWSHQFAPTKLYFHFLSHWMGYDRGESFPFNFQPDGNPFGSKSKGKQSLRSYPIQYVRNRKYSFLSVCKMTRHFGSGLCFIRPQMLAKQ